jgi:Branched-chain amino acid transport protein (AzlD)
MSGTIDWAGMTQSWWWPYAVILIAGWLATDIWRWLGVILAGRLREDSEIMVWVRAVATALVAGVIARLILFPVGALADSPMALRVAAIVVGFIVFKATREKVVVGILSAELVLLGGWYLLGA